MKLTLEEQSALVELLDEPGFPVLMKIIRTLSEAPIDDMRSLAMSQDSGFRLIQLKSQYDGVQKLLRNLEAHLAATTRLAASEAGSKRSKPSHRKLTA
jgi:hypothetical protein